jgi:serine/threonine-protein kinase
MGEVYRAHDLDLKRAVAIKVLPEVFASDVERVARFQREAEVLATLNHPNIAAIYGLERSDGTTALVMELVEGLTLADRIAQGPVAIDEVLSIGRQLAEALEAAHEHGIVHRDLKPSNIKLRPDGTVKVLDFGLAKVLDPTPTDMSQSPTITSPAMTRAGVILGTAAYMSPEQAKGGVADKRSDVWSFAAVLYEMLTGTRAFEGEDVGETMASVLKSEPDWSRLPADVPPPVVTVLKRCLVKDRRQRVSDMSTPKFVLKELSAPAAMPRTALAPAESANGARRGTAIAIAVILTAAAVGVAAWMMRPTPRPPDVARFSFIAERTSGLTISPAPPRSSA